VVGGAETEKKRASLKRNHTDDSDVERRVDKLLYDINFSATESVDESKILSRCSATETTTTSTSTSTSNGGALRSEVETQTMTDQELAAMHHLQSVSHALTVPDFSVSSGAVIDSSPHKNI